MAHIAQAAEVVSFAGALRQPRCHVLLQAFAAKEAPLSARQLRSLKA